MAATPRKRFVNLRTPHVKMHTVYYCTILYIFSPLQVKNKTLERVTTPASILGPVSVVTNT